MVNQKTPTELVFLQGGCKAYSSSKPLQEGQYVIPFSFKLPEDIPGTYFIKQTNDDGEQHDLRICYTVEMFLDTDMIADESLRECFSR